MCVCLTEHPEGVADGIHITCSFPASKHFGGPVDGYGKDPRDLIKGHNTQGKATVFNYLECYDLCVKHMSVPANSQNSWSSKHKGTWACNGRCCFLMCIPTLTRVTNTFTHTHHCNTTQHPRLGMSNLVRYVTKVTYAYSNGAGIKKFFFESRRATKFEFE